MDLQFSFIIPVYNRPQEIKELLESFSALVYHVSYEIVIIEDGSTLSSKDVIEGFSKKLDITYLEKENTGPGDSRNYGMQRAKGNYFIVLDSDCILPETYLQEVTKSLDSDYVDFFGGPDNADESFTNLQKAINFSMTRFLTTGGIRGKANGVTKFEPRSFNMGISKKAFEASNGFGRIHPGEDPDLTIRLWGLGFTSKLIENAFVYHKRRISWSKFYTQVKKFGLVRPILNTWHPSTKKIIYWFPTCFTLAVVLTIILALLGIYLPIIGVACYYFILFVSALISTKNVVIAFQSLLAVTLQFFGYGLAFIKSTLMLSFSKRPIEQTFPKLFFKSK